MSSVNLLLSHTCFHTYQFPGQTPHWDKEHTRRNNTWLGPGIFHVLCCPHSVTQHWTRPTGCRRGQPRAPNATLIPGRLASFSCTDKRETSTVWDMPGLIKTRDFFTLKRAVNHYCVILMATVIYWQLYCISHCSEISPFSMCSHPLEGSSKSLSDVTQIARNKWRPLWTHTN